MLIVRWIAGVALVLVASAAQPAIAQAETKMAISSPAFAAGANIPERFTCKGANSSPPLKFSGVPTSAKSLALIVDDPDAPGGLFTHWLLWKIAPATIMIGEKTVPSGTVQGTNDFGKPGYGGPCPPSGTHRYFFRLFALDRPLDLAPNAKRADFDKALAGHVLARAELMARSTR